MDFNKPHKYLGKNLTNIIRVIRNIGFTTSPERTIISPKKIGATIEKMDHELPNIYP